MYLIVLLIAAMLLFNLNVDKDLFHYLLSIKKLKCAFASIALQKMVQFISLRL